MFIYEISESFSTQNKTQPTTQNNDLKNFSFTSH